LSQRREILKATYQLRSIMDRLEKLKTKGAAAGT
jgi:hypothetical protein